MWAARSVAMLLAAVNAAAASASPDAVAFSRRIWLSADGLPEDFAQALAQTPDGYLWIGSSGGLARFDGVRFTVFSSQNEPAFHDDSVYALLVSANGTLWIGTEGGGLIRYGGGKFRAFGAADGLTNGFVRVIYEDRDSQLWVGTDDGLFRRTDDRLERVDGRGGVPQVAVHSIWQDREGRLLVGGSGLLILSNAPPVYITHRRKAWRTTASAPSGRRAMAPSGSVASQACDAWNTASPRIRSPVRKLSATRTSIFSWRAGAELSGSAPMAMA